MKTALPILYMFLAVQLLQAQQIRFTYDGNGNSKQRLVLTGADNQAPALNCPPAQILLLDANCTTSLPTLTPPTLSDNCTPTASITLVQQPAAGSSISGAGFTSVQLNATDQAGNSASCTVTVERRDTTRPQLICPGNQQLFVNTNCQAIVPNYFALAQAQDNCGISSNIQSPPAGTSSGTMGLSQVTLLVKDVAGNSRTCSFMVEIRDTISPKITCPVSFSTAQCAVPVTYNLPIISDNCSMPGPSLQQGLPSGVIFPVGVTLVRYRATDTAGNTAECNFTVTLQNTLSTAATFIEPTCAGEANGSAVVAVSGGTGGYSIQWSNGQSGPIATGLVAGVYSISIQDAQGCQRFDSVTVTQPTALTIALVNLSNNSGGIGTGLIDVSVSGGTPPYQFVWFRNNQSAGINTEDAMGLTDGTYQLRITDVKGCVLLSPVYTILIVSTTGLDSVLALEVFPNPTTGIFYVRASKEPETLRMRIFAASGQLLHDYLPRIFSEQPQAFNLEHAAAGLFILEFSNERGKVVRQIVRLE
jgi:hypothetical protein